MMDNFNQNEFENKLRELYHKDERENYRFIEKFLQEQKDQSNFQQYEQQSKKRKFWITIIIAALILIAISVSISYFIITSTNQDEQKVPQKTTIIQQETITQKQQKNIYIVAFRNIFNQNIHQRILKDLDTAKFEYFLRIYSSNKTNYKINLLQFNSKELSFQNAEDMDIGRLIKNICSDLPEDSNAINQVYFVGNLPDFNGVIQKNMFSSIEDYKNLTKNNSITITILDKDYPNDITLKFKEKMEKYKNEAIRISINIEKVK